MSLQFGYPVQGASGRLVSAKLSTYLLSQYVRARAVVSGSEGAFGNGDADGHATDIGCDAVQRG